MALEGCKALGYVPAKREYPLMAELADRAVLIAASAGQLLVNVCFTVRNWGHDGAAEVSTTGAKARDVRQCTIIDTDGTWTPILWLELDPTAPVGFTIRRGKPR